MQSFRRRPNGLRLVLITAVALGVAAVTGSASLASHGASSNVLNIAYADSWQTLDPAVAYGPEADVLSQVYQTLTSYTPGPGATAQPDLATSWSQSDHGLVWTFKLRHGVTFQDGEPFNSAAVKTSINRLIQIGKGAAFVFSSIRNIDTPSPYTVVFHLSAPRALDLMMASGWGAYIVSPQSAANPSSWFDAGQGYGTGPYMWQSYTPGQSAVLKKFEGYWGGWHSGQAKTVVYNFTPDPSTRVADMLSGTDQLSENPPVQDIKSLESNSSLAVHKLNIVGANYVVLDTSQKFLNNPLVRRAVLDTFPTTEVLKSVYKGTCLRNSSLIASGIAGHTSNPPAPKYSIAAARKLLAKAGHPKGGFSVSFVYIASIGPEEPEIGQLWLAKLKKVGIKLKLASVSPATAYAIDSKPNNKIGPNAEMVYWPPNFPAADQYLEFFDAKLSGGYIPFYSNHKVTKLITRGQALSAVNTSAANTVYGRAERIILHAAPGMNICDKAFVWVSSSNVSGFKVRSSTLSLYDLRMH